MVHICLIHLCNSPPLFCQCMAMNGKRWVLWYIVLSGCLCHWLWVLTALPLIQLLANAAGKTMENDSCAWNLATYVGNPDVVLGAWLWLGLVPTNWGVSQQMKCFSLHFFLFLSSFLFSCLAFWNSLNIYCFLIKWMREKWVYVYYVLWNVTVRFDLSTTLGNINLNPGDQS